MPDDPARGQDVQHHVRFHAQDVQHHGLAHGTDGLHRALVPFQDVQHHDLFRVLIVQHQGRVLDLMLYLPLQLQTLISPLSDTYLNGSLNAY